MRFPSDPPSPKSETPSASPEARSPSDASQDADGLDVLIVEDDDLIRVSQQTLFERHSWRTRSAATVNRALEILTDATPRWVVLDLMLPDGDGATVLQHIRKNRLPTRVVVLTGVSDLDRLDSVRQLGPDALLEKPVDFDAMIDMLMLNDD